MTARRKPKGKLEGLIEPGAPPSSYAIAGLVTGESGALLKVVGLTAIRAVFIAPGIWGAGKILGIPELKIGWKLAGVAALTSVSLSAFMYIWYGPLKGIMTSFSQQNQPLPTTHTLP